MDEDSTYADYTIKAAPDVGIRYTGRLLTNKALLSCFAVHKYPLNCFMTCLIVDNLTLQTLFSEYGFHLQCVQR